MSSSRINAHTLITILFSKNIAVKTVRTLFIHLHIQCPFNHKNSDTNAHKYPKRQILLLQLV